MTRVGGRRSSPRVPSLAWLVLSMISLVGPAWGIAVGGARWSLVGYFSALLVTIPAGLTFRLSDLDRGAAFGAHTHDGAIRRLPWLFAFAIVAALVCALRFAWAVS